MQHRTLAALALAVALAACSSDGGPGAASIDQMRVVKVSGDQEARVPSGGPSAAVVPAGVRFAVVGSDGFTDEPLVARVEATGGARTSISGPSLNVVPAGTLVHWQLPEEAGRLFGGTTSVDDSAYVINRFAPGTKAGTYAAQAGRLVDGEIVIDAEWELVVLPGPVAHASWDDRNSLIAPGAAIDLTALLRSPRDAHGNEIPTSEVVGTVPITWRFESQPPGPRSAFCRAGPGEGPDGDGWTVTMPDLAALGYPMQRHQVRSGEPERDQYAWVVHATLHISLGQASEGTIRLRQLVGHTDVSDPPVLPGVCD